MSRSSHHVRRIGFVVYPQVTALDFVGPMEAFAGAEVTGAEGNKLHCYEPVVIGLNRRPVRSASGVRVNVDCTLETAPPLDTVLIPGGSGLRTRSATAITISSWLLQHHKDIRRIASVCTGIYALAETGLLDGRHVTTHWAFARDVNRKFPKLKLDADAIFLKDGKYYTSAGITAGIDLSLALIEEDHGPDVALAVARELVVYLKRSGDQAQYSEPLYFQTRTADRFDNLVAWITENLDQPLQVEKLAGRVNLGPRHFNRVFVQAFGMTPSIFVERQRMAEACRHLATTNTTVDTIAEAVGFNSADAFRRVFMRHFNVAPSEYRARFTSHAYKHNRAG